MSGAKPALGFVSRTEAVLAFRREGLHTREIADRLGIETKTVTALECSTRKRKQPRGDGASPFGSTEPRSRHATTVDVPYELRAALRPAARRRDLSVEAVALRILETAAYGNLIDAILDDVEKRT